ncbi:hypothetical protein GGF31_006778 [Allomyces arbusculus]|nr:hypothetical protein GGF31_006778 [Allomyces arbusculus]
MSDFSLADCVNTKKRAGRVGLETARALVVSKSLQATTKVMGLDREDTQAAVIGMRCLQECRQAATIAAGRIDDGYESEDGGQPELANEDEGDEDEGVSLSRISNLSGVEGMRVGCIGIDDVINPIEVLQLEHHAGSALWPVLSRLP